MNESLNRILPCMLGFILLSSASFSQESALPQVAEKFEVNGHTAILYAAPEPADGRPWVWYAPSLRGGLSLRQRTLYYESFLKAGIAIAGYDLGEVRGSPASTKKFTAFYEAMVRRGFSPKPILLGQSRGGMMMLAWATAHPDQVGAFVGIYPVCNLVSWPLTRSRDATLADFGLTEEELRARLKQFNPVDNLSGLAKQRVPMFIVHGDSDQAVPLDENSALLRDRYRTVGGPISVKVIEGEGHRVCPAFFECRELVDFVLRQARTRSATSKDQLSSPQDDSGTRTKAPLRNDLYNIWPQLDGSLHMRTSRGYHLNTRFNTAQEKPDFPLHGYQHLKPTTSIHFNHILPHTNLIIDYLYSRCRDLSDGQIEFPAEYAEGYAYLQGRIYGAKSGSFYNHRNVRPWMPPGLVKISDVDVNFVSARSKEGFYIALMNSCDRELQNVEVQLSADRFEELPELAKAKVWMANEALGEGVQVLNGRFQVSLNPKGITAIHVPGLRPRVQFQDEFGQALDFALVNEGESTIAGCEVEASVLTFGPELRWIYAWLRSDQGKPDVNGLKLTLTLDEGTVVEQTDDSFPYEFHVELPKSAKHAEFALTPLMK